jgi:prepilin-type N-terminal cleavage/methylation domain-containing protein
MNINIKEKLNNKNFLTGMKLFFKNKTNKKSLNKGFTLVELLVTITIFVIITGVVLVNSNKFDSTELLNNFTYDVALTIKQAQSYGVNARENNLGSFNTNLSGYGVYFNVDPATGAGGSNTNFVLFNDISDNLGTGNPDKIYNGSITSCPTDSLECVQKYSIKKGLYIKNICAGASESTCDSSITKLSILFYRPNLAAFIYTVNGTFVSVPQSYAKITLASLDGATSSVVITAVGQIYVKR